MSFKSAFSNLIGIEGGYINDKSDRGKETYRGISRVYHPSWKGWEIIDKYKTADRLKDMQKDKELDALVEQFYKREYWDKFRGDMLPPVIAEELLEQSVNLGSWKTAGVQLQKALNLLNRNGKLFPDLKVDGIVGLKTLEAVGRVKDLRLLKVLNGLQFMRYLEVMENNPEMEKFVGWFERV